MIIVRNIPIYWGIEEDAEDRTFFTKAVLNEILPPFRISVWAFRIRVSHRHWLHVGRFVYQPTLRRWGIAVDPGEIGRWGAEETTADADEGADEVREARPGEPSVSYRIVLGEDSGVLHQPAEPVDRSGLDAGGDGAPDRGWSTGDPGATAPSSR